MLVANAERESAQIRGEGDARAIEIYAAAYDKDQEFYSFLRSLEAYDTAFGTENDIMLMDTRSEFFRYFDQAKQPE